MLSRLKRIYRFFLPRLTHPILDAEIEPAPDDARFESAYLEEAAAEATPEDEGFILSRFSEGRRWRMVLQKLRENDDTPDRPARRTLDVGGGNGAIELSFAAAGEAAFSVEMAWSETARLIHRTAGVPFRRVVADASRLPFATDSFDQVVCFDTIEHFREAARVCGEIARVVRPGGRLLVTTTPRWRYAFRPDPHFGIRGLVLLPPALQRWVAEKKGFTGERHFVDRIYGTVRQMSRLFPGMEVESILSRSRAPKNFAWDAVVWKKG